MHCSFFVVKKKIGPYNCVHPCVDTLCTVALHAANRALGHFPESNNDGAMHNTISDWLANTFRLAAILWCRLPVHRPVCLLLISTEIHGEYSKVCRHRDFGLKYQQSTSLAHRHIRRLPVSGWFSTLPHGMPSLLRLAHFVFVVPPPQLYELLNAHAISYFQIGCKEKTKNN